MEGHGLVRTAGYGRDADSADRLGVGSPSGARDAGNLKLDDIAAAAARASLFSKNDLLGAKASL